MHIFFFAGKGGDGNEIELCNCVRMLMNFIQTFEWAIGYFAAIILNYTCSGKNARVHLNALDIMDNVVNCQILCKMMWTGWPI